MCVRVPYGVLKVGLCCLWESTYGMGCIALQRRSGPLTKGPVGAENCTLGFGYCTLDHASCTPLAENVLQWLYKRDRNDRQRSPSRRATYGLGIEQNARQIYSHFSNVRAKGYLPDHYWPESLINNIKPKATRSQLLILSKKKTSTSVVLH